MERHLLASRSIVLGRGALACAAALLVATAGCCPDTADDTGEAASRQCHYPAGPYGYDSGEVPPPTLSWAGWAEGGGASTVTLRDYFDCDGSKGVNALLVDQSTAWCGVCQTVARKIGQNLRGGWSARGIHVITLLTEGVDGSPATIDTALAWKRQFGLNGTAVAADPGLSLRGNLAEAEAPYPYEIVIEPRTMRIVDVGAGYDGRGDFPSVVRLAERNAPRE
jgi:hypothetical protein